MQDKILVRVIAIFGKNNWTDQLLHEQISQAYVAIDLCKNIIGAWNKIAICQNLLSLYQFLSYNILIDCSN